QLVRQNGRHRRQCLIGSFERTAGDACKCRGIQTTTQQDGRPLRPVKTVRNGPEKKLAERLECFLGLARDKAGGDIGSPINALANACRIGYEPAGGGKRLNTGMKSLIGIMMLISS